MTDALFGQLTERQVASLTMVSSFYVREQQTGRMFLFCDLSMLLSVMFTRTSPVSDDLLKVTDPLFGPLTENQVTPLTVARDRAPSAFLRLLYMSTSTLC